MSAVGDRAGLEHELQAGALTLGLPLTPAMLDKLGRFIELLQKWNRVYNLTAIREPASIVSTHLLDSLAVATYLNGDHGADIGTGAGFPGIPLAIWQPEWEITLLDSSQKKTAFLRQVAAELDLGNIKVVCERVETWKPTHRCDWVVSRAFADLDAFIRAAGHLLGEQGRLIAMKGVYPREEIARLPQGYRLRDAVRLSVPGLSAQRHLIVIGRA